MLRPKGTFLWPVPCLWGPGNLLRLQLPGVTQHPAAGCGCDGGREKPGGEKPGGRECPAGCSQTQHSLWVPAGWGILARELKGPSGTWVPGDVGLGKARCCLVLQKHQVEVAQRAETESALRWCSRAGEKPLARFFSSTVFGPAPGLQLRASLTSSTNSWPDLPKTSGFIYSICGLRNLSFI